MEEECECQAGAPTWVVTFADLMSLLLTFFVLLLSFSSTEITKFKEIAGSLRDALGMRSELDLSDQPSGQDLLPDISQQQGQGEGQAEMTAEEMAEEFQQMLQDLGIEQAGAAKMTDEGVLLRLSGDLFFESGSAVMNSRALPVIDAIANQLRKTERPLDVIGHTDNLPISTPYFPSNWELSAARAGQAVRFLAERGIDGERMRAIGYAETAPLGENQTVKGRAGNRRVEFLFRTRAAPAPFSPDRGDDAPEVTEQAGPAPVPSEEQP